MVTEAELKSYEAEAKRTFEKFREVAELYHEEKADKLLEEYTEALKEFAKANKIWIKALELCRKESRPPKRLQ